jgi:hypothetical protein
MFESIKNQSCNSSQSNPVDPNCNYDDIQVTSADYQEIIDPEGPDEFDITTDEYDKYINNDMSKTYVFS